MLDSWRLVGFEAEGGKIALGGALFLRAILYPLETCGSKLAKLQHVAVCPASIL